MKQKVIVLGAGRVGGAMAIDLKKKHDVKSVDLDASALDRLRESYGIATEQADLKAMEDFTELVADFDLVINAVPGFMGYETLRKIIETGKNVVDIAFFAEDPFGLDQLAKEKQVTVVVDCGVAPGMGNIIFGHHDKKFAIENYECLVGGLPVKREWPYEYKAVFSPIDVIEEYVRPARFVQHSQMVVREALSDTELVEFDEVGTLESWNSDGLRSLIRTMKHVPNMIEKTLRYPGNVEYLRVLRETGFFSYDEVEVDGKMIRPIDLTAKLLFPKWQLKEKEEDFTIMRIRMEGVNEQGNAKKVRYDLYDLYDRNTDTISMARTTGYTCTAVANLILDGHYQQEGINPPEYVGVKQHDFDYVLNYLAERGVVYKKIEE